MSVMSRIHVTKRNIQAARENYIMRSFMNCAVFLGKCSNQETSGWLVLPKECSGTSVLAVDSYIINIVCACFFSFKLAI